MIKILKELLIDVLKLVDDITFGHDDQSFIKLIEHITKLCILLYFLFGHEKIQFRDGPIHQHETSHTKGTGEAGSEQLASPLEHHISEPVKLQLAFRFRRHQERLARKDSQLHYGTREWPSSGSEKESENG